MQASGIYEIVNTVNGKRYIGSSVNLRKRRGEHWRDLRLGKHHSSKLQRAWNKYGEASFKFLPILTCAKSMLLFYEQQLLDKVKPEYNILPRAGSSLGSKRTPEQCAALVGNKRAVGNKNAAGLKWTPAQYAAATRRVGVPLSEAHRAAIGAGNVGRAVSAETRAVLSAARKGVPNPKVAIANAARVCLPETRAKKSVNGRKRIHSEETKKKISASNTGRAPTAETREKMRVAAAIRWGRARACA